MTIAHKINHIDIDFKPNKQGCLDAIITYAVPTALSDEQRQEAINAVRENLDVRAGDAEDHGRETRNVQSFLGSGKTAASIVVTIGNSANLVSLKSDIMEDAKKLVDGGLLDEWRLKGALGNAGLQKGDWASRVRTSADELRNHLIG